MKKKLKIIIPITLAFVLCLILFFHFYGKKDLTLITKNGELHYRVESALTPEKQQKGLMYRKHLSSKNGMIFLFDPPRVAHMWMKNTYIPLDMIFFDPFGRVVHVHHNAIPHDETVISSQIPVIGVLEINAGEARKYGIDVNTRLKLEDLK